MAQSYLMTANDQFEKRKNAQAGAYTTGICLLLGLFLVFASFTLPEIPPPDPPLELQGIEVNLGIDETGMGDVQPLVKGEPAPDEPSASQSVPETSPDDVKGDENETEDVPTVKKTEKPSPVRSNQSEVTKTPKPATPKNVMKQPGATGPGGNNSADNYNTRNNQGIMKGPGKDMGDKNGTPNSDRYGPGGGTGNGGIVIRSGLSGRKPVGNLSFKDDFNENAKVALDITIDANGKVLSATVNPRGTTTTNAKTREVARKHALRTTFNKGTAESSGTIVVELKLNG